ncbi:MAG: sensor protein [Myxococcaceae bacterium]|nr:sensor protein [Myxococcaceae bacterium]
MPRVWCDRTELQQVLLNLTDNALEAMRTFSAQPRLLELSAVRAGAAEVCVGVRDSGPGLGADREQAFRAFYSSKPEGLGLGLNVSRSLVRSLGGRLWASANEHGGETFCFTLPIAVDDR